jgi:hypothetical protein
MYIKPIKSGSFFGLKNNVEYEISFSSNSSKNPLNVIGIAKINIVMDGDIIFSSNNLHNYKDHNMEPLDIILLSKAVDVQMNRVIKYEKYDGSWRCYCGSRVCPSLSVSVIHLLTSPLAAEAARPAYNCTLSLGLVTLRP